MFLLFLLTVPAGTGLVSRMKGKGYLMLRLLVVCILTGLLVLSCGEEDNGTGPDGVIDGASLLGLADSTVLLYLKVDSVVVIDSTYRIDVTSDLYQVLVTGSDNDWMLHPESGPSISIKLTGESVFINGYAYFDSADFVLTYFAEPSLLLRRELIENDPWSGLTPPYATVAGDFLLPTYVANFGFYFTRTYLGREDITVVAGDYTAHRFDTKLFLNAADTVSVMDVTEYFVPGTGLVKRQLKGAGLTRVLSLVR